MKTSKQEKQFEIALALSEPEHHQFRYSSLKVRENKEGEHFSDVEV